MISSVTNVSNIALTMPLRNTSRGYVVQSNNNKHVAIIKSGPMAGTVYECDCGRRQDHYLKMAKGMNDMHPRLF